MTPQSQYPTPYQSAHSRARLAVVLLAGCGLLSVFTISVNVITLASPQTIRMLATARGTAGASVIVVVFGLFGLLAFGIGIGTTIVFLVWLYQASSNLPAFGHAPTEISYSPGWAVGSFFVPFVNLFIPYLAISELWRKSEVEESPGSALQTGSILTTDWPQSSGPPLFFPGWWLSWITSGILSNLAALNIFLQLSRTTIAMTGLVAGILRLAASGLAIMVVREIDQRQEQASQKLPKTLGYRLPPPPPVFHDFVKKSEVEVSAYSSDSVGDPVAKPDGPGT